MYDIFFESSAKVERFSMMYKCLFMDSPIIAIGKVEATRQDNSYGAISGHIVLLALFSVRFLAKSKRAGSLWPFGSTKRYLKEAPRRTPSSRHIQYFCGLEAFSISAPCASSELVHFRHRIGEKGVELILKESIRINFALEDRKKRIGKTGRTVVDARATRIRLPS